MDNKSYSTTFHVDQSPDLVFKAINNARGWWSEDLDGCTKDVGDRFTVRIADILRCDLEVQELMFGARVSWLVVDNYISFLRNKRELAGSRIEFSISRTDDRTRVDFTHVGLGADLECFEVCVEAWNTYLGSLSHLITTGEHLVQSERAALRSPERPEILAEGKKLYEALKNGDAAALETLLRRDFQGHLSPGLPEGLGRQYAGRDVMLEQAWGRVDELYELDLQVERLFVAGDCLIGLGTYQGIAKGTGRAMRAAFAHFWTFDGSRFKSLQQVTDTALWRAALLA